MSAQQSPIADREAEPVFSGDVASSVAEQFDGVRGAEPRGVRRQSDASERLVRPERSLFRESFQRICVVPFRGMDHGDAFQQPQRRLPVPGKHGGVALVAAYICENASAHPAFQPGSESTASLTALSNRSHEPWRGDPTGTRKRRNTEFEAIVLTVSGPSMPETQDSPSTAKMYPSHSPLTYRNPSCGNSPL